VTKSRAAGWFPTPVGQPKRAGEGLYELEIDGTRHRCELRDFGEYGVEARILISGELWQSCRFFVREWAVRWTEGIRDRLIRGEQIDWP